MYLPLIGLTLALAFCVGDGVRAHPALRAPVAIAAALALAALAITATRQAATFRDPIALHGRAAAVTSRNYVAHQRFANALRRAGRFAEAEREFSRALAIVPNRADLRLGLGDVLMRLERPDEAIAQYQLAVAADPRASRAQANLALALAARGRLAEARVHFERALSLTAPGAAGAAGRQRVVAAVTALAARQAAGGHADEAARLRALAAELARSAPPPG
jgi:tetratricopeptide (TPR) repeat protein